MLGKLVTSYFCKMNKLTWKINISNLGIFFKKWIFLFFFMELIILNICIYFENFFKENKI